jgi:hypothetical protein
MVPKNLRAEAFRSEEEPKIRKHSEEGLQYRRLQEQEVALSSGVDTFPQVAADSLNLASSLSK